MAKRRGFGEGSIFEEPSGNHRAQVSLDNKRISWTFRTKEECKAWIRQVQNQKKRKDRGSQT